MQVMFAAMVAVASIMPTIAAPHQGQVKMTMGDQNDRHVNIIVSSDGGAIHIDTQRVGAPGSLFRLSVDRPRAGFSQILSRRNCHYDDQGSVCTIRLRKGNRTFARVLAALRTGRRVHVEIQNAGNMLMSEEASLKDVFAQK